MDACTLVFISMIVWFCISIYHWLTGNHHYHH